MVCLYGGGGGGLIPLNDVLGNEYFYFNKNVFPYDLSTL